MSRKLRLDVHLLTKGLAKSRQEAQQIIRAGKVRDEFGKILDKPGLEVNDDFALRVKEKPRFVSRGGEKLLGALESFPLKVEGRICIDAGISTGGFTDCLLQHGASFVYGIDVGYGQTAWELRNDPRVFLKERTNLRTLTSIDLYGTNEPSADFAVADLSFISLRLVMPSIRSLLKEKGSEAIVLVKPQFEVGRNLVGKGGIVRDPSLHLKALNSVISAGLEQGWKPQGVKPAPIKGVRGNQEYLLWLGENKQISIDGIERLVIDNSY